MNDETELTAEQLLQATAKRLPPASALDTETAALRESFLQLGRAVEATEAGFDEAALIAKLTRACLADEIQPVAIPAGKQRRDWISLVLGAALAASALVAIVRTAFVWSGGEVAVTPLQPPDPRGDLAAQVPRGIEEVLPGWSDPLDEEIASAQSAVEGLADRATDLDGALDSAGWRLKSIFEELESGSL